MNFKYTLFGVSIRFIYANGDTKKSLQRLIKGVFLSRFVYKTDMGAFRLWLFHLMNLLIFFPVIFSISLLHIPKFLIQKEFECMATISIFILTVPFMFIFTLLTIKPSR